jgi:hypothetical protein
VPRRAARDVPLAPRVYSKSQEDALRRRSKMQQERRTENPMGDEMSRESAEEQRQKEEERVGYEDLSMNVVAASATAERSEAGRRAGGRWLIVIAVLAAAAAVFVGARMIGNARPGQEAEERLRKKLRDLPVWQSGVVLEAQYIAGDRLRISVSPRLSTMQGEHREKMREAAKQVMEVLVEERTGCDLFIDGYQGDEKVIQAEYRQKSTLVGPGGEPLPDIVVRVEGDPTGGIGEAFGRSGRAGFGR